MMDCVAVTGAEGFIGSHLVEALVRRGHRVRAMVLYNMFSSRGWLETAHADVLDQVDVVFGDVRDPASVRQVVEGASAVYHLAALDRCRTPTARRRSFVDTNVIGTLHVLEAVRACETPRLVHTSTSETYGTARTVPISEAHPLQAQSPYAASKVAADKLVESLYLSFGTPGGDAAPVQHLRPAPVGPRRHPGRSSSSSRRVPAAQAGRARPDPGLHVRHRHRAGVRRPGRGPGFARWLANCSMPAPARTWRSASSPSDIAGLMGVEPTSARTPSDSGPRTPRCMRLRLRRVEAARTHRLAAGATPGTGTARRPSSGSANPRNLARYNPDKYNQ